MEQKTIGKFIAALRKANGMTQKELAARLNVSDKTVSRWECDEGAPDLSAIPVLAEIFGVSCDELLRGERRPPAARSDASEAPGQTPKGEKQRRLLLKATLSLYRGRTWIAMGVSVVGLLAALIGNLAFLRAVLGFLLGAVFFAASIVLQAVCMNRAFLSVEDAELERVELSAFKRRVIRLGQLSIGLTLALVGFCFPLVLVDAYVGLDLDSMLLFGAAGAAALLLLYAIALYFLNAALLKRGVYTLSEREDAVYRHNHRLKRRCALLLAGLLVLTFVGHQAATTIWGPWSIMEGTTFHDYESFVAFMEQDIPAQPLHSFNGGTTAVEQAAPPADVAGEATYYDEYGNEISEEEAHTSHLTDKNGVVVCSYIRRNWSVVSFRYTPQEGTVLPITICTQADLQQAQATAAQRHVLFAAAYCLELAAVLVVYFLRRSKEA